MNKRLIFYAVFVSAGAFLTVYALCGLLAAQLGYRGARAEYTRIRGLYHSAAAAETEPHYGETSFGPIIIIANGEKTSPANGLIEINPDYAGWISVNGTEIDYPIVRGADNEAYLDTLFSGGRNPSGTVFMDYRCLDGFKGPVCVLYGHNMRDGSMFAVLKRYLDPEFMESHDAITVTAPDGEILGYRIYDAALTDKWDMAYSPGSVDDTDRRLLILSTCISGTDSDSRLLIYSELTN